MEALPLEVADFSPAVATLNDIAVTVATTSGDFGGLAGPIAGLGFLAGLIFFLSPPLADKN